MRSRQVRRGRAARTRRYETAVRRQITLVRHARTVGGPAARVGYADPAEFLRRGDSLDRFGYQQATVRTAAYVYACYDCGLADSYRGNGDGIGSCDCPRCDCGEARSSSFCTCDPACSYCLSTTCEDDCDEPDDDAGHGDDWPADVIVPVETTTAFREAGLL